MGIEKISRIKNRRSKGSAIEAAFDLFNLGCFELLPTVTSFYEEVRKEVWDPKHGMFPSELSSLDWPKLEALIQIRLFNATAYGEKYVHRQKEPFSDPFLLRKMKRVLPADVEIPKGGADGR